jgi:hypothetical protein
LLKEADYNKYKKILLLLKEKKYIEKIKENSMIILYSIH